MAFDPHAPYSSTMDDVPLKLLFSNLKNRRRGSKKTKEMASLAKPVADPSNNNQTKAQESHASAVERSVVEQNKKEKYTGSQPYPEVTEDCSHIDLRTPRTKDIKVAVETHPDHSEEGISNSLKGRKRSSHKFVSVIDPMSPIKTESTQGIQNKLKDTQMGYCSNIQHGDITKQYPQKKIKVEKEESDLRLKEHMIYISSQVKSGSGKVEAEFSISQAKSSPGKVEGELSIDQVKSSSGKSEAELSMPYGRVTKKYRKRSMPVATNLKDHTNPELTSANLKDQTNPELTSANLKDHTSPELTSALSGDITPKNLCNITEEQVASFALKSSLNKDDELMHKLVLSNSNERVIAFEPLEVIDSGSHLISRSQIKLNASELNKFASLREGEYSLGNLDKHEIVEGSSAHTCSNSSFKHVSGVTEWKAGTAEEIMSVSVDDDKNILPAIFSRTEYINSKKDQLNGNASENNVQYKSTEGQSSKSVKTNVVPMECFIQEEKINQKTLISKEGDDFRRKSLVVDVGLEDVRIINAGSRIAENQSKLVSSDVGKELRIGKSIQISPDEKLWEGCLQLNAHITVMALAFFKRFRFFLPRLIRCSVIFINLIFVTGHPEILFFNQNLQ